MKLLIICTALMVGSHAEWFDTRFDGNYFQSRDLDLGEKYAGLQARHYDSFASHALLHRRMEDWEFVKKGSGGMSSNSGSIVDAPSESNSFASAVSWPASNAGSGENNPSKSGAGKQTGDKLPVSTKANHDSAQSYPGRGGGGGGGGGKHPGIVAAMVSRIEDTGASARKPAGGAHGDGPSKANRPPATMAGGRRVATSRAKTEYRRKAAMVEGSSPRTAKHKKA